MVDMLYLISGAVASGKSMVSWAVTKRLPNLVALEEHVVTGQTGLGRLSKIGLWIEQALRLEEDGKDAVLAGQSPLGEVLASPRAIELEGIAPCLLDAHDFVRLERWLARGVDPDWPVIMDHFCWAAFHRLHARDPRFEQRVLKQFGYADAVWKRWDQWTAEDPRWKVFIYDSSQSDKETTTEEIAGWIRSVREQGAPLMRKDAWWE
jgi:hypothetical protein